MSAYSLAYLRNNTLVGDVDVNGLPWTARALGVDITDLNNNDLPWLFAGAVPLDRARDLFASYAVTDYPLAFVREYRPGDESNPNITVRQLANGKPKMSIVTDESRKVIVDAVRDTVHFVPKDGYLTHHFGDVLIDRTARIVCDSAGDLHIDSIGVLAEGGEGWVSIATGGLLTLPEGVKYYPHVLAAGSHNGTLSSTLAAVITDTVCDNTRDMALGEGRRNGTMTKARHTRYSDEKLAEQESEARTVLGLIETASDDFAAEVKRLCETTVTDDQWSAFIVSLGTGAVNVKGIGSPIAEDAKSNTITRAESFRETVTGLYVSDPRCAPWHGTAWGAQQAVNTFDLWERGTRGETDQTARTMREAITGQLGLREAGRKLALAKVLATV